jgi:catechol 2,3-dioxygenase-like lactoylglutathione lyase family enzyme
MASRLFSVCIDAHDPLALAQFWAEALGLRIVTENPEEVIVGADERSFPGLCFLLVPDTKVIKNRLHLDLAPDDRDAEVERLIGLGATRADVGQPADATWVVLADPEGNEFCVLRPRDSLVD